MRNFAIIASILVLGLAVGVILGQGKRSKVRLVWDDGRKIPKEGLVVDPQGVGKPGNPKNAVEDLKVLYRALIGYRKVHNKLPHPGDLFDLSKPISPGIRLRKEDLKNPDHKFADGFDARRGDYRPNDYAPAYSGKRYDGTPKPAFPKKGERDVWFYTMDYTRSNQVVHQDFTDTYHYKGFMVVLWSDGKVEQIPYSKVYMAGVNSNSFGFGFKGETGLPKTAIPITEWWKKTHGSRAKWD